MITFIQFIWTRRVIFYIILVMVACPLLMVLGVLTPDNLRFLEPVICPAGMRLEQVTESQTDLRGTVAALDAVCTDGKEKVDVTGKFGLFVCGTPILVGILLVLPAFLPSRKQEAGPEG